MPTKTRLAGLLPLVASAILACSGSNGGGPSQPGGSMTGSWQATHTILVFGALFATCSGPMTIASATSTTFSGTFTIVDGGDCEGSAQFSFTGTRSGNQATLTVTGDLVEALFEVCTITAGDQFWVGTASDTSIDLARDNTIECTDPDTGEIIVAEIRLELTAQKTG